MIITDNIPETIVTERLTVRPVEESDWPVIQAVWEDVKLTEYNIYDTPKITDSTDVRRRVARWAQATRSGCEHMFFIPCLDGRGIGYFSLNICPEGYELGYGFLNAYHGKGYARESLTAILGYIRGLGAKRITAGTAINNLPSVALLRSVGFEQTGTERVSFYKDSSGNDIFFDGGIFEIRL